MQVLVDQKAYSPEDLVDLKTSYITLLGELFDLKRNRSIAIRIVSSKRGFSSLQGLLVMSNGQRPIQDDAEFTVPFFWFITASLIISSRQKLSIGMCFKSI